MVQTRKISKIMVANRGEIAIRVLRAANELGLATVAIFAEEDKLALHRFKADETYLVGQGLGAIKAYLSIPEMIRVAKLAKVDAIHPGYGFLSENPEFADACAEAGIIFIGPTPEIMRRLGNKVSAREVAVRAGTPVMPATGPLPEDKAEIRRMARSVGYPLMLKAPGGRGGLWQWRGLSGKTGAPGPPCGGAAAGRPSRQHSASVRAGLHCAAAQSKGRRTGPGAVSG